MRRSLLAGSALLALAAVPLAHAAPTLTTLVSFDGANGAGPDAGLLADAAGNLFGTTLSGGARGRGTVFQLAKGASGYTLTTLVSFDGSNGAGPVAGLLADAAGNLFGTTSEGGAAGQGAVFELAKGASSYTFSVLANFDRANGASPGGLLADGAGNLFGATIEGGTDDSGTVFELARGAAGYTLATLARFDGSNGGSPCPGLVADSAGNLFGTAIAGDANNSGTVFELSGAGFVTGSGEQRNGQPR